MPDRLTGHDLRQLRKDRGWTQEQLADALGLTEPQRRIRISKLERHDKPLAPGMAARVKLALATAETGETK